jgi:hypothetical protein
MTVTNNLAITLVEQSQSQKEVTVNEALVLLDALLNTGVIDKDLATPPVFPASGDLYIVAASPTGAWTGKAKQIAWYNQTWRFIVPKEGLTLWVRDEDKPYSYNGTNWISTIEALTNPQFSNIGIGTAPDPAQAINLYATSILYNSGGSFTQQMNKNAAGDNVKLLFQQGFTTYGELGLLGDNEFSLKVSDGTNFYIAWKIRQSGTTNFVKEALISDASPINHKNYIVNGNCKVAQHSALTLVKDVYGIGQVDRFAGMATGTAVSAGTLIYSAFSGKEYIKFNQVTITGTGQLYLRHRIEAQDSEVFVNQKGSFSCNIQHSIGSSMNVTVFVRKANAANNFSAVTAIANSSAISVPNSTETTIRFEDVSMGDCSNGIEIELKLEPGAITTKDFLIRNLQFELGSIATQFVMEPLAETLAKCKRFYQKLGKGIAGAFSSGTEVDTALVFPLEFRAVPTGTLLTTTPSINHTGVGGKTGSSSAIVGGGTSYSANGAYMRINGFSSGTAKEAVFVTSDNILAFDSEL